MKTDFIRFREELLNRMGRALADYGFHQRAKNSQEFHKGTSFGCQGFHLVFVKHKDDIDVAADVGVRFDALEDLVNATRKDLSAKQKKETYSLGADLGNIIGEGDKRWTIVKWTDIDPVLQSLKEAFKTIALPYIERYSDMTEALDALSSDPEVAWLFQVAPIESAIRAIGLAYLLNDRRRFSRIAANQTKYLTAQQDHGLPRFLALKEELEERLKIPKPVTRP